MENFEISQYGQAKFKTWLADQNKLAVKMQKAIEDNPTSFHQMCWEVGEPYAGAIGGIITFSFIPTSVGCIVKAIHNITKNEIDLTDYDNW